MIVFVHILINIWRDLDSFIRFTIIFIGQHMIFVKYSIRQFILYSISYHERFYTNQFRACYDIGMLGVGMLLCRRLLNGTKKQVMPV